LGELWNYRVKDEEFAAIMTGVCVATDYADRDERTLLPIVFPIVMEKRLGTDFSQYREEVRPSSGYDRVQQLLEVAVRANMSTVDVWSRFAMPGKANGGPR
jgi:hypothetical protein